MVTVTCYEAMSLGSSENTLMHDISSTDTRIYLHRQSHTTAWHEADDKDSDEAVIERIGLRHEDVSRLNEYAEIELLSKYYTLGGADVDVRKALLKLIVKSLQPTTHRQRHRQQQQHHIRSTSISTSSSQHTGQNDTGTTPNSTL